MKINPNKPTLVTVYLNCSWLFIPVGDHGFFFPREGLSGSEGVFSFALVDPGWALLDEYTIYNVYMELKHQINLTNSSKLNKIK